MNKEKDSGGDKEKNCEKEKERKKRAVRGKK